MKGVSAKSIPLISAAALLVITPLFIPTPAVKAQTERSRPNTASPVGGPRAGSETRPPSIRERQLMMDEVAREAAKPRTSEMERVAFTQIAEDFKRIQILNNKMMGSTMKSAAPDYESIADTTAEIRRRATRIRNNLSLPKAVSEETEKRPEYKLTVDAAGMKAALLSLDGSIMNFIENPIFQNPYVIDVERATKASRDLEIIIESSRLIRKDAERLSSLSKKN
jgi:hypothetical protein